MSEIETVNTRSGVPVTRVADKATGHHYTIAADSFDPARHWPLKSPALDSYGDPAGPKFKSPAGAAPAGDDPEAGQDADGGEPPVYADPDNNTEPEQEAH